MLKSIIETSSTFNKISNESAKKAVSPQKPLFPTRKHRKTPSTEITKSTDKQKHELKQSLQSKLQPLNLPKSAIGK